MAYTSIIPVSRLDNSITYIRNKDKSFLVNQRSEVLVFQHFDLLDFV